jgi:hypothetical protein
MRLPALSRLPSFGTCALCQRDRDLRLSHIVPEFAYKRIYDERHKMIVFDGANVDKTWKEQKGLRDRLLCSDCEEFLNTSYEERFCKLWFGKKTLEERPDLPVATLNGLDYPTFKLFHLSVLWRASVCKNPAFAFVDLGPHNERIRKMLLERDAGSEWDYPIICAALTDGSEIAFSLMASPRRLKFEGHIGYEFTFAGCVWIYYVTSHRNPFIEEMAFKPTGVLPVHRWDVGAVFRSRFEFAKRAQRRA